MRQITKLEVLRCADCGTTLFPARYLCPVCGGAQWTQQAVAHGTVLAATVVSHRVGASEPGAVHLASVRTDAGPVVIARLDVAARKGETVSLEVDEESRILARAR
ncbi:Zn-ribbon domain-containing OB-fold protein [Paraburkholderia oxyphila]|uniref:Zn-ribbon domain-containing OB-fold protein n=1 Tax=Paraburkholderia oxyphila TaxID=614212 RepID=UPI0004868BE4|nr:zinc ribbon domain-containing protein [Paraburkholderia oxyphila]